MVLVIKNLSRIILILLIDKKIVCTINTCKVRVFILCLLEQESCVIG